MAIFIYTLVTGECFLMNGKHWKSSEWLIVPTDGKENREKKMEKTEEIVKNIVKKYFFSE